MIYTFYSYKGGVGRSMALANVAEWLYHRGLRVVMIDWDLEAPGLENFFYSSEEKLEHIRGQLGLIDTLTSYKRHFPRLPLPSPDRDMVTLMREHLPPISHTLYPIRGGDDALDGKDPALFLLPSGWRSSDRFAAYAQAVQSFDWSELYASYEGEAYFEWLRTQLLEDGFADVVLIDSRTGITEMGGVCSRQLADVVVAFCVPNIQNLRGTETMVRSFKGDELLRVRSGRPLDVVVVPTRVEASGPEARGRFEEEFRKLDSFTPVVFKQSNVRFWDLQVPYVPKYAYLETLAITSGDGQDELAAAYRNLATHLARLAPEESRMRAVLAEDSIEQRRTQSDMITLPDLSTVASGDIAITKTAAASITSMYPSVEAEPPPPFMPPQLPSPFVPRPDELEKIFAELVRGRHTGSDAPIVALHGTSGSGKTVLATAVCHDARIKEAFKDGILWVTLGAGSDNLTKLVEDWIVNLTGRKLGITSVSAAAALLSEVLSTRAVLLVINDVQNAAHLEPFLQGGARCAHLITTRDSSILPPDCVRIDLSTMESQEAVELLGADLPAGHEQELLTMTARLGEQALPFALALANGVLQQQVNIGDSLTGALSYLNRTLEPLKGSMQTIGASLGLLNEDERARYRELSIFAENVSIPLGVVEKLWSTTGGLDSFETKELCVRLDRMSLLQLTKTRDEVRLHPVLRGYLAQQGSNQPVLHQRLLDAYRPLTVWADLPTKERYIWDNLAHHLVGAGLIDELVRTVKDVRYLAVKAFNRDALAVEQDLLMAEVHRHRDPDLTMLHRIFANTAHLLSQCETLEDVVGTLHSRIAHQPILAGVASAAEDGLPRPFVTARHPLPDLPDPSLSRTLWGHQDAVLSCAISADGGVIVSASADSTIKLWDALHGTELDSLVGHSEPIRGCAISRDGAMVVSASEDNTLKVWDIDWEADSSEQITLRATLFGHEAAVSDCDISSDKRSVVSASEDYTLKLWETSTGQELQTFVGHTAAVRGCAISADGAVIVSASLDSTLKVWDAASGEEIATLSDHKAGVRDCAISADGSIAVSASRDYTLKVWDVWQSILIGTLEGHTAGVNGCAISADGNVIVSAGRDGTLKVWDAASSTEIKTLAGHSDWVKDCAISADGVVIASASEDCTLKVWNAYHNVTRPDVSQQATVEMNGLSVSEDSTLVVCASSGEKLTLWDANSGSFRKSLEGGHSASVLDCAVSPTGQFIVSASSDATLKVWDADTGRSLQTLYGHSGGVRACSISPDEGTIVSGSADSTLMLWNLYTGELLKVLTGHRAGILACAFSPDGYRVVSSSDDNTLKVWDVASGTEFDTLYGHESWVLGCAFSPDGHLIGSASADRTLKVWDASGGAEHLTLRGHRAGVFGCAFSPDGTRLVSVSGDNTLRVWDVPTGACMAILHVDGHLSDCAWSSNGEITAVGNRGVYFLRLVL